MARCSALWPIAPSAFITSASVFHSFVFSSSLKSWSTVVGLVPSNRTRTLSFFFTLGHLDLGSARVPCAGFGVAPKRTFFELCYCSWSCDPEGKFANAGGLCQHAGRVRYPIRGRPAE